MPEIQLAEPSAWRLWREATRIAHLPEPPRPRPLVASCGWCWGQRAIWEPSPLGLLPVVCERCAGSGDSYD